jgi:plastocyanin
MKSVRIGTRTALGAVVLVALIGVACASKSPTTSGAGGTTGSTSPAAARGGYGDNPYGGGGESPSAGPASASATVTQGAGGQLVFSPTTLTVKQGDTIEIDDIASIPHTFTIDGQGIDVVNEGGQKQTVAISLAPGTYSFVCRFHASLGMKGTLTVTGG